MQWAFKWPKTGYFTLCFYLISRSYTEGDFLQLFLKAFTDGALTTSSDRLFHVSTTLFEKKEFPDVEK